MSPLHEAMGHAYVVYVGGVRGCGDDRPVWGAQA